MRIRITKINGFLSRPYGEHPLYHFGVCVGQEFDTIGENEYGFVVEHDGEPLFIRRSECEVLED